MKKTRSKISRDTLPLKELSREINMDERGFNRQVYPEEEMSGGFQKIQQAFHAKKAVLKFQRHLMQLFEIGKL